jgi:hypothetical protein
MVLYSLYMTYKWTFCCMMHKGIRRGREREREREREED